MECTKDTIRSQMRRRRAALPPADVRAAGGAVLEAVLGFGPYRAADAILAYVATDNEVPTDALWRRALADGKRVFLPRVEGAHLAFVRVASDERLRAGRFGIPEPIGAELYDMTDGAPAVAFLPLTAWDRFGGRLGRGRGYYDRALRDRPASLCLVGLAYAFQEAARVPVTADDARLDYVITERAVVRSGAGGTSHPRREEDTSHHEYVLGHTGQRHWRRRAGLID